MAQITYLDSLPKSSISNLTELLDGFEIVENFSLSGEALWFKFHVPFCKVNQISTIVY